MIYCKDNKELRLSGTTELLLAQATAVAVNVIKQACAGNKDEMRKVITEKFVELVVKGVCGEDAKVSNGDCMIKVENGITTMAGNAKDCYARGMARRTQHAEKNETADHLGRQGGLDNGLYPAGAF